MSMLFNIYNVVAMIYLHSFVIKQAWDLRRCDLKALKHIIELAF